MSKYEVYCDESRPELFVANLDATLPSNALIGSLWLPAALRKEMKAKVRALRGAYGKWGEAKWGKVSPSSLDFYRALVDLVLLDDRVRFRCIVVDASKLDLQRFHQSDGELGFYKFYYQLLCHWLVPGASYSIFCDDKVNRDKGRLATLGRVLQNARRHSALRRIESIDSSESVITQLCDVLLGAVQAKFNGSNAGSNAKLALIAHIEQRLGHEIAATYFSEHQFNVFRIQLSGAAQ